MPPQVQVSKGYDYLVYTGTGRMVANWLQYRFHYGRRDGLRTHLYIMAVTALAPDKFVQWHSSTYTGYQEATLRCMHYVNLVYATSS